MDDQLTEQIIEAARNINKIKVSKIGESKLEKYHRRALETAYNSHDSGTKVGALLINIDSGAVMSEGYNGFVRGAPDSKLPSTRPDKYKYIVHAENNLICNAVRHGVKTDGCFIYTTLSPCTSCARILWQCGIQTIFFKDVYRDFSESINMGDMTCEVEKIGEFHRLSLQNCE